MMCVVRTKRNNPASRDAFSVELLECRVLLSAGLFDDQRDIGAPALPGSSSYADGVYTVTAGGSDIGGNLDQFHFSSTAFSSDGSIVANVTSLLNTNNSAKAGVMVRSGFDATAAFSGIFITPANGVTFVSRTVDGGTAAQTISPGPQPPRFLKLARAGSSVAAFQSANGVTWTAVGTPQTIALGADARAGLAVTSRNVAVITTATVRNVSLLPPGWNSNDIGAPVAPGFAGFDPAANVFAVDGGGEGVGGTADQFTFAGRSMTGSGSVIARVDQLTGTGPGAFAGITIRNDLAAGSTFAGVSLTPDGVAFQWRASNGAAALSELHGGILEPVWLKLTRSDSTFSAHYSTDQSDWIQIGASQTIGLASATAVAGLGVASGSPGVLGSATFSNVGITQPGFSTVAIGGLAALGSAIYDSPSNTYTAVGGGEGIGGAFDQFTFTARDHTGDGSVVAYVESISAADPTAQAGLMFRVSDAPDAAFAAVYVTPQNGVSFAWRTTSGGLVQRTTNQLLTTPVSLRLSRSGDIFAATYSTDGVGFFQVGPTRTLSMPQTVLAGFALAAQDDAAPASAVFTGVRIGTALPPGAGIYSAADELFLNDLQERSSRFFWDETNPNTGMVPDGSGANGGSPSAVSSIAATGFGLTALTIADARGWLSHADAYQRALNTVNFLRTTAAQVNGFFYHFINPVTGARSPGSELSPMDTALLMAGVLNVAEYWPDTPLRTVAMEVFDRVNWPWMQKPNGQFYGHWTPENGFEYGYGDFSEAALLYLLSLGSATHPTAPSSWLSWSRTPVVSYAGMTFVTAQTRALFTHQYPHAWFDLRGLTDSTGLNYFANSQTATLAQRQMFINLSTTYPQYGPNLWGATAADGPNGYTIWGGPPAAFIDGTVVPTAPGGSLAFTPRRSVDALRNMLDTYGGTVYRRYGFVDAFNPHSGWTSSIVLGIDVGMMLVAAENSRSNFVWDVFDRSAVARNATAKAFPSIQPSLVGAVSRKSGTGTFDLPVDLSGGLTVENRADGPTRLVLSFAADVVKGPGFAITLSSGAVSGSSITGSNLTIDLSGATDAQTLVIHVADVRHLPGSAGGGYTFELGVLLADANQDGRVNLADFNALASNFGSSGHTPAGGDFNFDGVVNLADFNLLAGQFGKVLDAGGSMASLNAWAPPAAHGPGGALAADIPGDDDSDDEDAATVIEPAPDRARRVN